MMSQSEVSITTASVSDRGLNERRPLNEDSFLADERRRIFAVADGVGGAQAGEVASQTAIEVLDEAFRHHNEGDDAEDLIEIAIQRANSSIHQLSREHSKLSMMATTIVVLHLDGYRATIAHVGDSRLYRLTPDGELRRETDDHSVVEEEVRAGRMTPQQAANHPSRNVISRALGAEASVEVDTKVLEFETGTTFLLCTDGITRHIPDEELRSILISHTDCAAACAEMKRLCFERGAEDNLTAVVVRVGEAASRPASTSETEEWDDERTLVSESPASVPTPSAAPAQASSAAASLLQRPFHDAGRSVATQTAFRSSADGAAQNSSNNRDDMPSATNQHASADARAGATTKASGGAVKTLGLIVLLLAASIAAFFGGMFYQRQMAVADAPRSENLPSTSAVNETRPAPNAVTGYEQRRREVDRAPAAAVERMTSSMGDRSPLSSENPEFLYLYGRALLLSGKPAEAIPAFERAIERIDLDTTAENAQLKIEARMAAATAALMSNNDDGARRAAQALQSDIKAEPDMAPQGEASRGAVNEPSP